MTNNQKRAHDLALIAFNYIDMESLTTEIVVDGKTVSNVNIYRKYKELYDTFLPYFNRDYPDE